MPNSPPAPPADAGDSCLYEYLLGDAWAALPASVRSMHDVRGNSVAHGSARVDRGNGFLAALIARLFGLPAAGESIPLTVSFGRAGREELWVRDFAGSRFESRQWPGSGRYSGLLCEQVGPFRFGIALIVDGDVLRLDVRRWDCLGMPLPARLAPGGEANESDDGGRFRFYVEIRLPLAGLLVRYQGFLETDAATDTPDT